MKRFRQFLARRAERFPKAGTEMDQRRTLLSDDYFALHLFGLFNPVVKTMRGLCRATDLPKMRRVCAQRVSLGSFSAGQHLFDPAILEDIVRDLAAQAQPSFGDARLREAIKSLTAVDGTVLRAIGEHDRHFLAEADLIFGHDAGLADAKLRIAHLLDDHRRICERLRQADAALRVRPADDPSRSTC